MYDRIVVALDGSEFSRAALPYALMLARSPDTTVELVSAVELLGTLSAPETTGDLAGGAPGYAAGAQIPAAAEMLASSREARGGYLRRTVSEIQPGTPADVRWTVLEGDPSRALVRHVEETDADLVVLSTHGRGGIERAWLGSVADRLVRRLATPVLLVRPSEEDPGSDAAPAIRRVLVPLDGSRVSEAVLVPARHLAGRLGAGLVLLRVIEPELRIGSPYLPHEARHQDEHMKTVRREIRQYLDGVAERLRDDGAEVAGIEVRFGRPADVIPAVAEDGAELVAMATHGRGGLERFILGSVSDKVLRRAAWPMLLVRPAPSPENGS